MMGIWKHLSKRTIRITFTVVQFRPICTICEVGHIRFLSMSEFSFANFYLIMSTNIYILMNMSIINVHSNIFCDDC